MGNAISKNISHGIHSESQMHDAYIIHINNYLPFDVRYHVTFCLAVVVLDGLAYYYHKQIEDSYREVVKSLR